MHVTVYTRNNCAACLGTKAQLTKLGVSFTEINVEDPLNPGFAQQLVDEGHRAMPVVKVTEDGELTDVWAGSNLDKIKELAARA